MRFRVDGILHDTFMRSNELQLEVVTRIRVLSGCKTDVHHAPQARFRRGATVMTMSGYDIAPCVVPTYLSILPYDPSATGVFHTSTSSYHTGYNIQREVTTGRITNSAPSTELDEAISVSR